MSCPINLRIYNEMTTDMLKHVIEEWGFKEIEIEVGNEPTGFGHAEWNWWMSDISNPPPADSLMWEESLQPYCELYKNIAITVKAYRDKHPAMSIRIGGPASNFGTFLPNAFPWLQKFTTKMLTNKVPLDFVSFHCYHKSRTQGTIFLNAVADLKKTIADFGSNA